MSTNEELEQVIKDKGLNAPRVTLADAESKIKETTYVKHQTNSGSTLRWAVIELENGFVAVGKPSISVSPENDDEEIGEAVAYNNSFSEIWSLEGYLLKQKLHEEKS